MADMDLIVQIPGDKIESLRDGEVLVVEAVGLIRKELNGVDGVDFIGCYSIKARSPHNAQKILDEVTGAEKFFAALAKYENGTTEEED